MAIKPQDNDSLVSKGSCYLIVLSLFSIVLNLFLVQGLKAGSKRIFFWGGGKGGFCSLDNQSCSVNYAHLLFFWLPIATAFGYYLYFERTKAEVILTT